MLVQIIILFVLENVSFQIFEILIPRFFFFRISNRINMGFPNLKM